MVYEQAYYDDRRHCADAVRDAVESHVRGVSKVFDIIRTLPDPPPQRTMHNLLDALANLVTRSLQPMSARRLPVTRLAPWRVSLASRPAI